MGFCAERRSHWHETAGRCLHVPPKGEEQGEAEDAEHAGAYLNVVLPGALACAAVTHRPASLRQARVSTQALRGQDSGSPVSGARAGEPPAHPTRKEVGHVPKVAVRISQATAATTLPAKALKRAQVLRGHARLRGRRPRGGGGRTPCERRHVRGTRHPLRPPCADLTSFRSTARPPQGPPGRSPDLRRTRARHAAELAILDFLHPCGLGQLMTPGRPHRR
jgi:hypothetical protein